MSCSRTRSSRSIAVLSTRAAQRRTNGVAALTFVALLGGACSSKSLGAMDGGFPQTGSGGAAGSEQLGRGGPAGSGQPGQGGSGGAIQPGSGGSSGGAGGGGSGVTSKGGTTLRLLTGAEYLASIQALLGPLTTQLVPPSDISVAGFVSVGAGLLAVTSTAQAAYEAASLAATAEVFGDAPRWQKLVGCTPKDDLGDACVTTFIKTFGRSAYRRDLTDDEVALWLGVARNAAMAAGTAAQGLATVTSGLLQSPNFLYRVETNALDRSNGRLKYDGLSMATRLSYTLTGGPPSGTLLTAATSGQLDTADGVRTAAAPLLASAGVVDRMTAFFTEYAQVEQVSLVVKSPTLFPTFNLGLQTSMVQAIQLFVRNVVLGPTADVRSFYDSDQTFVDANLASFYGARAPASGFAQVTLPPSSGRAGILGQIGVLAAQSQVDRTSPSRRGIFITETFLCTTLPPPPPGVDTSIPPPANMPLTTRQQLEAYVKDAKCAECHDMFDPLGFALEHFDPIGRYRDTENGLPIDATGMMNGTRFDGEAQLAAILRQDARVLPCLLRNFYRHANGRAEDDRDPAQIDDMGKSLAAGSYVWSSFLHDFVASDAFRSAPALPATPGSP